MTFSRQQAQHKMFSNRNFWFYCPGNQLIPAQSKYFRERAIRFVPYMAHQKALLQTLGRPSRDYQIVPKENVFCHLTSTLCICLRKHASRGYRAKIHLFHTPETPFSAGKGVGSFATKINRGDATYQDIVAKCRTALLRSLRRLLSGSSRLLSFLLRGGRRSRSLSCAGASRRCLAL
jgi:hypothetical protein